MNLGELQFENALALFAGFRAAGIREVAISPGSRSTPLVLGALAAQLDCHSIIDERAAGFFALGQGRFSGRPSVVVCTSGTAGTHLYPAIAEASFAHLPLIVLTADRSPEHQGCGALQTIDQVKLFGSQVRAFHQVDLADRNPAPRRAWVQLGVQAAFESTHPVPGPVHLNVQARKPLEPSDGAALGQALAAPEGRLPGATRTFAARRSPPAEAIEAIIEMLLRSERGLIVAGPLALPLGADPIGPSPAADELAPLDRRLRAGRQAVFACARSAGLPIFAEATSQLRFVDRAMLPDVEFSDLLDPLLRSPTFRGRFAPDLVLQLGMTPTSGGWQTYLEAEPCCPRVVVAPYGWNDPDHSATLLLSADVEDTANAIRARLEAIGFRPKASVQLWRERLRPVLRQVQSSVAVAAEGPLTEAFVVREVVRAAPADSILAVGNGLPIRHLDTYAPAGERDLVVLCQRGASGIDGLVSGAAGAASIAERPVTLLLGDVALLHDLSGLALARTSPKPLVIVVINNDGGRIFEQLSLAQRRPGDSELMRWFTTPHGRNFESGARFYGIEHVRVTEAGALGPALWAAHAAPGCTLIEAVVRPEEANQAYLRLWNETERALAAEGKS